MDTTLDSKVDHPSVVVYLIASVFLLSQFGCGVERFWAYHFDGTTSNLLGGTLEPCSSLEHDYVAAGQRFDESYLAEADQKQLVAIFRDKYVGLYMVIACRSDFSTAASFAGQTRDGSVLAWFVEMLPPVSDDFRMEIKEMKAVAVALVGHTYKETSRCRAIPVAGNVSLVYNGQQVTSMIVDLTTVGNMPTAILAGNKQPTPPARGLLPASIKGKWVGYQDARQTVWP